MLEKAEEKAMVSRKKQAKEVDYILEKLHLEEGMTLLDIGCGWGYLMIEAAKKYKIKGINNDLPMTRWY